MESNWMKARQTQYLAYATVYIAIVIAVLILANFLAQRTAWTYDSTSNKRFSLSDQTVKVVKNLSKDVDAVYVDKATGFKNAKDLLDRYQALSSKLHVKYIDPSTDPMAATATGLRAIGTLAFISGTRRDEAKSISEEELTGALIRVIKDGDRTVCFTAGMGEFPVDDESSPSSYSGIKSVAEHSNYKVKSITLLDKPEVPKECTVVVVAGPKKDYPETVALALKTYVEGGGRAMFLLDPPLDNIGENQDLAKVLSGWGVTPASDIVLDGRTFSAGGRMFKMGPEIPLIDSYESHAIVRELKGMSTIMPVSRPLEVKSSEGKATAEKLFSASPDTYAKSVASLKGKGTPDLSASDKDRKGPFVIGAAGMYKTGQPNNDGRFVVFGSSSFAANKYMKFGGNADLAGNAINWLAADEDLISIRPKDPEDRRIQLTNNQMSIVRFTTLLLLPLLIALAGFSVWWQRR